MVGVPLLQEYGSWGGVGYSSEREKVLTVRLSIQRDIQKRGKQDDGRVSRVGRGEEE